MDEGTPRFRYDARLANEIELRWQDRWEREGTFHSPNPPGPEGPDALGRRSVGRVWPRGRAAQVLPGRLLPLSQWHRAARRSPAGVHRHRRVRPVPAHDRASRAAPLRVRHLRAARGAVRHRHRPASGRDRAAERGRHAPPAAAPGPGARPPPRDPDQRPVLLPLDAVDLPADLQQLVRPGRGRGRGGRARPVGELVAEFAAGPAPGPGRAGLGRPVRRRAARRRRRSPAGLPGRGGRQLVPGAGHRTGRRGGDRRGPQRGGQLSRLPQGAAAVAAAHHRLRRAAAGGPGRRGLAGEHQAPATQLDRPERGTVPATGLAVLPAAVLGRAVPHRLRRGRPVPADRAARGDAAGHAAGHDRLPAAAAGRRQRSGARPGPRRASGRTSRWTWATARSATGAS